MPPTPPAAPQRHEGRVKAMAAAWPAAVSHAGKHRSMPYQGAETESKYGITTDDSYDLVSLVAGFQTDEFTDAEKVKIEPLSEEEAGGVTPGGSAVMADAETDNTEAEFEMIPEPDQVQAQGWSPGLPMATPRWTQDHFKGLEQLMGDLGKLNKQLLQCKEAGDEQQQESMEVSWSLLRRPPSLTLRSHLRVQPAAHRRSFR